MTEENKAEVGHPTLPPLCGPHGRHALPRDGVGVKTSVDMAERFATDDGDHFRPMPLLKEMAANGETFYARFDPCGEVERAA